MIQYIILGIVLLYLCITAYIRITLKFWSYQPVFHYYNLYYWLRPPGIINKELPSINKFCNFKNIQVSTISTLNKYTLNQIVNFIKNNYLQTKNTNYNPTYNNIIPYLKHHNANTFVSLYTNPKFLIDLKKGTTIPDENIIGLMTTRPLYITLNNNSFCAYYADYLCVDKRERQKGIAPSIIQTHIYKQVHSIKKNIVYIFKRETKLNGIVPLTVYNTYLFDIENTTYFNTNILNYHVLEINKKNLSIMMSFIKENKSLFKCFINPHLSNLSVYMLIYSNNPVGMFVFRDTATSYQKGKAIELSGSIFNSDLIDIFINGFKLACKSILQKYDAKYLLLEDISYNHHIFQSISLCISPIFTSPTALYFYNYAVRPILHKDVFAIY